VGSHDLAGEVRRRRRPRRGVPVALMTADAGTDPADLFAGAPLTVTPARAGSWRVVTVRGTLDHDGEAALVAILTRAVATSREPLALDLREAEPADADALTLLVNDVRRLHHRRPDAVVICPDGPVRTLLEERGVARRVTILDDPADLHGRVSEHPVRPCPAAPAAHEERMSTAARRSLILVEATLVIEARHDNPALALADVARAIATSARQLQRVFAEHAGGAFRDEIIAIRMQHAAALLHATDLPVAEVGRRVGYGQPSHFAKAFRRHHGVPPSGLRRAAVAGRLEAERRG
jgi:AraC-like DNA-binding protein